MKWITARNLEQWADALPARVQFPAMIAELIVASSPGVSSIRFPQGDKGQVKGFDGALEADGAPPYVPEGRSIWEFGVTGEFVGKANDDYKKRTAEVPEKDRAETTFVFVSPRTWNRNDKLEDWVKERADKDGWKGVRFYDGSVVEDWLYTSPAVASRFARYHLELAPANGARSLEEFWEEFSNRYQPALTEDVVIAEREEHAARLVQQLVAGERRLPFLADSPDEVVAFAVAAIRKADAPAREYLEARSLVVETAEAAYFLAVPNRDLIFLPRGQAKQLDGLLAKYGPTVISAGPEERGNLGTRLPRPRIPAFAKALITMGLAEDDATALARKCGRSLVVLSRQIPGGSAHAPAWLEHANTLIPAMLAGGWKTTEEGDKEVLRAIGGQDSYASVEAPLRPLARLMDPPIDNIQEVWSMRASVDAFLHLGQRLGEEHLKRFSTAIAEVFAKAAEQPKAHQPFRLGRQKPPGGHSGLLRDGLMTTLLHMACLHEQAEFSVPGATAQEFVNDLVRGLPGLKSDSRLMESLRDGLPLLAEASPDPFFEALEHLLEGDAAGIRPIFNDQEGLFATNPHVGFLWALETLAWMPHYLHRSSLILARLAEIDPGGQLSNRPIESLRGIFLTWSPNTYAPLATRMGVLASVVRGVPSVAWPLLSKLLPRSHDNSSPHSKPRFRDSDVAEEELTYGVVWAAEAAITDLVLERVNESAERWEFLITAMGNFQETSFYKTLDHLASYLDAAKPDDRRKVWDALRKERNRHVAFANTEWALNQTALARVTAIVDKHQPDDPLLQHTWLFDDWTPDIGALDWDKGDPLESIEQARLSGLEEIRRVMGLDGIVALGRSVKLPRLLTTPLLRAGLPRDQLFDLTFRLFDEGGELTNVSVVLIADGAMRFGDEWLHAVQAEVKRRGLSTAVTADLLMGLPETRCTWEIVDSFGADVGEEYWRRKMPAYVTGSLDDALDAAERYLARGRPMAAIQMLFRQLKEVPTPLLVRLLESAVGELNAAERKDHTMSQHYIKGVFDTLRGRADIREELVAGLEFRYLPAFGRRNKPVVLHRLLSSRPEVFMEVINAVYKPATGEAPEPTEAAATLARAGYQLLSELSRLPGQEDDEVDEEVLLHWCTGVLDLAHQSDRVRPAEMQIGNLLAHAPSSKHDGAWPHRAVRTAIETLSSANLERGIEIERFNMRGVYSKAIGEGGQQEHELSRQYAEWAALVAQWPRTSAMLLRISTAWSRDAKQADTKAAQAALRG